MCFPETPIALSCRQHGAPADANHLYCPIFALRGGDLHDGQVRCVADCWDNLRWDCWRMVRIDDVNDAFIFVYGTGSSPHKCDANIRRLGSLVLFLLAINGNLCIHVVCIIYAYTIQVHIYNIIYIYIVYTCMYILPSSKSWLCLSVANRFGLWPRTGPPREGSWAKLRNFNVLCFVFLMDVGLRDIWVCLEMEPFIGEINGNHLYVRD